MLLEIILVMNKLTLQLLEASAAELGGNLTSLVFVYVSL